MKLVLLSISAFVMAASANAQTSDQHKWYISAGVGAYGNNPLLPQQATRGGALIAKAQPAFNVGLGYKL